MISPILELDAAIKGGKDIQQRMSKSDNFFCVVYSFTLKRGMLR